MLHGSAKDVPGVEEDFLMMALHPALLEVASRRNSEYVSARGRLPKE
jgi:hypothetical protein